MEARKQWPWGKSGTVGVASQPVWPSGKAGKQMGLGSNDDDELMLIVLRCQLTY